MADERPVIVRRIRKVHKGHGGAWKVAFADFATAMMAFFLVLWLSESTNEEQKNAISGYFTDPVGYQEGGSPNVIDFGGSPSTSVVKEAGQTTADRTQIGLEEEVIKDLAMQAEMRKLADLKEEIDAKIDTSEALKEYKDQLIIDITRDGLRIQIVDKSQRPMFASGDAYLKPHFEGILYELANTIATVSNEVSISGHTDSAPFFGREDYSNWELSSDRANAARRALVQGGISERQISEVVGLSSSALFDASNPLNPVNRRISIVVLNQKAREEKARADGGKRPGSANRLDHESRENVRKAGNKEAFNPDVDLDSDQNESLPGKNEGSLKW